MKNKLHIVASALVVISIVCEVLLIVGSWIITTLTTDSGMQSLLRAEGVRWYIGSYADVLARPLLVWILLCGCAYGIVKDCGITDIIMRVHRKQPTEFIERIALQAAGVFGLLFLIAVCFLVFGPNAVLLSATGTVSDSSFSAGVIPLVFFFFIAIGVTYGYFSSNFKGVTAIFDACAKGIKSLIPILVLYIFIGHLYMTMSYVFN